jgi:hypothetical protein
MATWVPFFIFSCNSASYNALFSRSALGDCIFLLAAFCSFSSQTVVKLKG